MHKGQSQADQMDSQLQTSSDYIIVPVLFQKSRGKQCKRTSLWTKQQKCDLNRKLLPFFGGLSFLDAKIYAHKLLKYMWQSCMRTICK